MPAHGPSNIAAPATRNITNRYWEMTLTRTTQHSTSISEYHPPLRYQSAKNDRPSNNRIKPSANSGPGRVTEGLKSSRVRSFSRIVVAIWVGAALGGKAAAPSQYMATIPPTPVRVQIRTNRPNDKTSKIPISGDR